MTFPADIQVSNTFLLDELISGLGYTWQTWVPSYGATGSMTYTSVSATYARYVAIGDLIAFEVKASGTTGGTASFGVSFTLPVTSNQTADVVASAYIYDAASKSGIAYIGGSGTLMYVSKYDFSNYGLGAGRQIWVSGHYERA